MSIASALALFFSLPAGLTSAPQLGKSPDSQSLSTWQKIRRIDYIGAALMVCIPRAPIRIPYTMS